MLGIMRKYKESILIKIIFAIIVFVFIGTIFLVWGTGDTGMSGPVGYVAKVNGVKITPDQFQRSYYNTRALYEQLSGQPLTEELEKKLAIKKTALDNLIDETLIRQEAKRMGVKASKEEVRAAIAAVPAFQVNGAFDQNQYVQALRSNRMSPRDFEASQELEIKLQKTRKLITDKAQVTDDEALLAFRKQREKLQVSYAVFTPAAMKAAIRLTDGELNAFLDANKNDFRTPELVSLSYILVNPSAQVHKTSVSEEEIQTYYQKNIDRYQGNGGILPLAEVRERVKAEAVRAKAAKDLYETVAVAMGKANGNLSALAQALGTKTLDTPLFSAAVPPDAFKAETEIIKRAFLLKENELAGPVESSRGIYVLKLKQRKPAEVPLLNVVRAAVTARATDQKARELAKSKAEEATVQLAKGQIAGLKDTPSFGYNTKGEIPGIGASPEFMEAAFSLTASAPAAKSAIKVGESWYALKLKSRTETDTAEFQKVKEQIKESLLPQKRQEAVAAWLKELRAKAKIEQDPALLAD
jgi:peptidyl-prolyl cis-trans isomerase D